MNGVWGSKKCVGLRETKTRQHEQWMVLLLSTFPHLGVTVHVSEDLIDLVLEPSVQHLVSFVQHKHLDVLCPQMLG